MSDKIKDGGPAFPGKSEGQTGYSTYRYTGMSLRDWLAGMAMQGLLIACLTGDHPGDDFEDLAGCAYTNADAMLKERDKEKRND